MVEEINTKQDVVTFIQDLAKEIGDYNPFADFAKYMNPTTNQRIYTDEEEALRKCLLDECFEVCGLQGANFFRLFVSLLAEAQDNITRLEAQLQTIRNRERKDYFTKCYTVPEVKARYLQLADEHSFYRGGDAKTREHVTDEYIKACDPIIMEETLDKGLSESHFLTQLDRVKCFIDIVALLLVLPALKIEFVNNQLRISSADYNVERELRKAGLLSSRKDGAWYYML